MNFFLFRAYLNPKKILLNPHSLKSILQLKKIISKISILNLTPNLPYLHKKLHLPYN